MIYIGIDLGGTNIKIGLVRKGHLLCHTSIRSMADQALGERLPFIEEAILDLLVKINASESAIAGVGLSFPSLVDNKSKKILTRYVKFTDADSLDLNGWSIQRWGVPLALENDARAALVAEWQYGAGRAFQNLVLVSLGTGFGTAVLIEGRLFRGAHHAGGNLGGHTIINAHGDICNCGASGCTETEASGWVIHQKWKDHDLYEKSRLSAGSEITFQSVFEWAEKGDALATQIRAHNLKIWAASLYNLAHNFDPDAIIVSGGVMKSKDIILPYLQKHIDENIWQGPGAIKVLAAEQTEFAGVLGMAYLAGLE